VEELLRGDGVAPAKSVLLLLLSKHPLAPPALVDFLKSARVTLIVGAAPAPSKQLAPLPPVP
jgi:hypothetical protein